MHDIRLMQQADIPGVLEVQEESYELLTLEDEITFRTRLYTSPDSAWVAEDEFGICAYLVAYRSAIGKVTPLGGEFVVACEPDTLYLHDIAIASRKKGLGLGSLLVAHALTQAGGEGLGHSALVSVQDSRDFWEHQGYRVFDDMATDERANLQTYPGLAWYMVKALA